MITNDNQWLLESWARPALPWSPGSSISLSSAPESCQATAFILLLKNLGASSLFLLSFLPLPILQSQHYTKGSTIEEKNTYLEKNYSSSNGGRFSMVLPYPHHPWLQVMQSTDKEDPSVLVALTRYLASSLILLSCNICLLHFNIINIWGWQFSETRVSDNFLKIYIVWPFFPDRVCQPFWIQGHFFGQRCQKPTSAHI